MRRHKRFFTQRHGAQKSHSILFALLRIQLLIMGSSVVDGQ